MFKGITFEAVENFFEEYDHAGSIGWLQEIINGDYDLGLLRKAINEHAVGNKDKCQEYVDQMFIKESV
jgi:hypothetical protein